MTGRRCLPSLSPGILNAPPRKSSPTQAWLFRKPIATSIISRVAGGFAVRFRDACFEHEGDFREFLGDDKGYLVGVAPYGSLFAILLHAFLSELDLIEPQFITVDRDDVQVALGQYKRQLAAKKVVVVDDDNLTGETHDNVLQALRSVGVELSLYVTWEDRAGLSDVVLYRPFPPSSSVPFSRKSVQEPVTSSRQWRPFITSYPAGELRAIKFPSVEERVRAIEVLFQDAELVEMPLDVADGVTLIVPSQAIDLLRRRRLDFHVSKLLTLGSLPAHERAELQRKYS